MRRCSASCEILPKRSLYRVNAALYSAYASDFAVAEEQAARRAGAAGSVGAAGAGAGPAGPGHDLPTRSRRYEALASVPGAGRTYTVSGLADVALYEGRFADAASLFADGAKADLAENDGDRAAAKFAALAYTELARGRRRAGPCRRRPGPGQQHRRCRSASWPARIYAAGRRGGRRPRRSPRRLGAELQAEPQAYGKIIDGVIALEQRDPRLAIKLLSEATTLLDTWIGRFDLGRAYLAAGAFPQADSEFDRCLKRSGEALSLFLDEEPTSGFLPPVYYYQGRVREGLKSAGFAEPYRTYLGIREKPGEDPLLPEIRKRIGA